MNAEDRMSRAFLIVIAIALAAGIAGLALLAWVFWSIASYF